MEITLDSIISFIGLFISGGAGAWFTWKWQKKKAKAEADSAEVDTVKNMQEAYDKMFQQVNNYLEDATKKVEGLRHERDYYKNDRDELRNRIEQMEKKQCELQREVTRALSLAESLRPFVCTRMDCKLRVRGVITDTPEIPPTKEGIEPYNEE